MDLAQFEIEQAIRKVHTGPEVIRPICVICKDCLNDWDVRKRYAVCLKCRGLYFPEPKIEPVNPGPKKAELFQLKDGKYVIMLE